MSADGTTPVLIDHAADDKVIPDSGLIVKYLESLFPSPPMNLNKPDPAVEATKNIFAKFAAYMKNSDRKILVSILEKKNSQGINCNM